MFNLLSKCFLSEPVRGLQELLIHFLLSKLWYYWIFRWLKSGLLVDRYFIPVYHIMYCMSFCFWLKSSGYYKGCWLTKGCWVVRKWLRSSHWTLFVLEVTLTLAKNDGDDTVGSSISLPTWEDLVELHTTGVGLQPLTAGVEEIQQTKRDEISTNTIAMWSGKPTTVIFGNYPREMWRLKIWNGCNWSSVILGGWYL